MKYLHNEYYTEVEYKRYVIHLSENIILREREESKSLRTEPEVINKTQIRRNRKVVKDQNDELEVKPHPKPKSNEKQTIGEKPEIDVE